jgi:hypothetical protein
LIYNDFVFLNPLSSDLGGKHRSKPVPPEPDSLMADVDPALMQQILHIAEREREPDVHHHCQANDLGARFEVTKRRRFCHPQTLQNHPARFKPVPSDSPRHIPQNAENRDTAINQPRSWGSSLTPRFGRCTIYLS